MSIWSQIYNDFGDWRLLAVCLILYSVTWFRGDAQFNIRKYERWDM